MKEFRLVAWPQLRAPFDQIGYRRLLNEMSHRHLSVGQLVESSGLRRHEVRSFLKMLDAQGQITERVVVDSEALFGSLRPLAGWIRRTLSGALIQR